MTAVRRAIRDQGGATAIEFSLVVLPFLVLLFAIIETALIQIGNVMLQTAVVEAGRGIMTGRSRDQDKSAFKASVCERLPALFDCEGRLALDVRTLKSLQGASGASPYVDGAYDTAKWAYAPGGQGAIVVVTAAYPWPLRTDLMSFVRDGAAGSRLLLSVSAFKNEQY